MDGREVPSTTYPDPVWRRRVVQQLSEREAMSDQDKPYIYGAIIGILVALAAIIYVVTALNA